MLESFEHQLTEVVIIPSKGGVFEVELDGHLIYSKAATGKHAEYDEVIRSARAIIEA
jgi:selenoprotein W-related protein